MEKPPGIRSVIVPAAFLIFWLGVCFSAVLHQLGSDGENIWMALLVIVGVGGFGAWGLGRSLLRAFRRWDGGR